MINKKRYMEVLTRILNEHYNDIKKKNATGLKERQQYIDGYLAAARALDVYSYDELKQIIDKIHFETFGKTIEERRKSEISANSSSNDSLKIPTFIRERISLSKK